MNNGTPTTQIRAVTVDRTGRRRHRSFDTTRSAWQYVERRIGDGHAVGGTVERRILGGPFRPRWDEVG